MRSFCLLKWKLYKVAFSVTQDCFSEPHRAPQSFQLQVFRRYNASFFKAATDVPVYLEENNVLLVIQIKG